MDVLLVLDPSCSPGKFNVDVTLETFQILLKVVIIVVYIYIVELVDEQCVWQAGLGT